MNPPDIAPATPLAIALEEVQYAWPGQPPVLSIPQLQVAPGERVFLRGPSGSGKSTLLGLVGGVLLPATGSVQLFGERIDTMSASARDHFRADHLGFIFQWFNLVPYLSVLDNVLLPTLFSALRKQRAGANPANEAKRLLGALGLGDDKTLQRPVTALSIGQQQRVAAARALLGRPRLIIADEPTSALDHDARSAFLELLLREATAAEATLLFVSHDTALAPLFSRTLALSDLNRFTVPAEGFGA
jgi:putative ABC transport system ATP-binding protein